MSKILGIDLGTNSIGLAVRDTDKGSSFVEQLDFFGSVTNCMGKCRLIHPKIRKQSQWQSQLQ